MKKERGGGESGVSDEVRGRSERNRISWEEKDDVIGQEEFGARLGTEREDGIGGIKFEDDKNDGDEKRKSEGETVFGRESCDEGRDRDDRVMIGQEEVAKGRSVRKGSEEDNRAADGVGSMTARSSLKFRSHSSLSSKAPPQMNLSSVETTCTWS